MNKEEKQKLQKRYDNLSLEERNAYEQIVDRRKISFMGLPYAFFKLGIELGLFFIIVSVMMGIPISTFREGYTAYLGILGWGILISLILIVVSVPFKIYKTNKLKRKLLSK